MTDMSVDVLRRPDPQGTDRILRSLTQWFGIEEAITSYVQKASVLDSYVVEDASGSAVGVALFERHLDESAD